MGGELDESVFCAWYQGLIDMLLSQEVPVIQKMAEDLIKLSSADLSEEEFTKKLRRLDDERIASTVTAKHDC